MKSILLILSLLLSVAFVPSAPTPVSADVVFINGNVYTANEKQSRAEAIAVKGDRIHPVPLEKVVGHVRHVDLELYKVARVFF